MSSRERKQSNQGHQAKMNSSDWSGLENQDSEDGWTRVLHKSSRKKLRNQKKSKDGERKQHKADNSALPSEGRSRSSSSSRARSRSRDSDSPLEQEQRELKQAGAREVADNGSDAKSKSGKRSRSGSKPLAGHVVPETPVSNEAPMVKKSAMKKVIKINAADGLTLDDMLEDVVKHGERVEPRDVDPSSKPPAPSLVQQVAEMLIADGSKAPSLHLGVPDTKRRAAALKRLQRVLGCNFMQAERLLTCSALTHDHGKESYAHALALGKYFKHGAQVQDGAEEHRVYLRKQLQKLGYKVEQVNLALADLEASLGVLNVTTFEVQGWLTRQALAYDENQRHDEKAREKLSQQLKEVKRVIGGQGDASGHVCNSNCCEHGCEKQPHLRKAGALLRCHGMDDVAAALHQAAGISSPSTKSSNRSAATPGSGSQALLNTVSNLHKEGASEDPHWNKPPAVKQFLLARSSMHSQMQKLSTMSPAQLLRTFDIQIATWPTFLEAVQHFPEACGIKHELSMCYQKHMEEARVSIQELELGSRMFLADILDRNTDLAVQQLNGKCNRKLVEAEFVREFKRCGDYNEAVQNVCRVFKQPSVPTPSWRQTLSSDDNTPRALGASYRIGQHEQTGTSARRRASGRDTVRMAAQQEKGVVPSTPLTEDRYHNADAVGTLRKMLKEDPELGNLPAEQQLRMAARRVNRRIDFAKVHAKESRAGKRSASEREDEGDGEEDSAPAAKGDKPTLKAKRSSAPINSGRDGGDESPPSSGSSDGNGSDGSPSGSSDESDGRDGSDDDKENSDSAGSSCGSSDDDSRESEQHYDTGDGFCVGDDEASDDGKGKKAKKKDSKQPKLDDIAVAASASKRASSVNSLGTPKKSEGASSVGQGGNIYFGEDELKKWTTGSEKYKQGFNWPAYIHHKQNYDNYCQFKGVHAARTFKSVIHARLVPALCGFCGLKRGLWKEYEDATVILAIEKALRPSKSTDFALELKQIKIADDKELSLMQNYTAFFENFSYKVAEAEDANRTIKPNVVKSTFKTAVSGHEILKLWLEEVPWRGLNKANARLLRKLREVRSWEQLQRKGITSAAKKQRTDDDDSTEARPRQEGKKPFRGKRAGKAYALKSAWSSLPWVARPATTMVHPPTARTTSARFPSSTLRTLVVGAMAGANILGLIKGVRLGTTTKICLSVSTHLAKLLSASAVEGMGTPPATAAFQMMLRASTCADTIKKKRRARHA